MVEVARRAASCSQHDSPCGLIPDCSGRDSVRRSSRNEGPGSRAQERPRHSIRRDRYRALQPVLLPIDLWEVGPSQGEMSLLASTGPFEPGGCPQSQQVEREPWPLPPKTPRSRRGARSAPARPGPYGGPASQHSPHSCQHFTRTGYNSIRETDRLDVRRGAGLMGKLGSQRSNKGWVFAKGGGARRFRRPKCKQLCKQRGRFHPDRSEPP